MHLTITTLNNPVKKRLNCRFLTDTWLTLGDHWANFQNFRLGVRFLPAICLNQHTLLTPKYRQEKKNGN